MEINVSQEQVRVPVTIVRIQGDIDSQTSDMLLQQAKSQIDEGAHNLLLDFSNVTYMSSYGIRALSQIYNWLREPGEIPMSTHPSPHLKLLHVNPAVLKVLELTGMNLYLDIFDDEAKALKAF